MRALPLVATAVALTLGACSSDVSTDDVAAQLVASDAGVAEASVTRAVDGLSTDLRIGLVLDDDELTADELREVLTLTYPARGDSTYTHVVAQGASGGWVDLEPAFVELGFPPADDGEAPPHDFQYGSDAVGAVLGLTDD